MTEINDISDLEVGDEITMTITEERTGDTVEKDGTVADISDDRVWFDGPNGEEKVAYVDMFGLGQAEDHEWQFKLNGSRTVGVVHTIEVDRELETDGGHTTRTEVWAHDLVKVTRNDDGHFVTWEYVRDEDGNKMMPSVDQYIAKHPDVFGADEDTTVDEVAP